MEYIKGYFYKTKSLAEKAINLINSGENIPSSADSITKTYCEAMLCVGGYYIASDIVTDKYLTNLKDIQIS
jgi:hypothetical protein